MRNYAVIFLLTMVALMGFGSRASANGLLTESGVEQPYDWQQKWAGINDSNLQPKADIDRVVSQDGTNKSFAALSLIKTYSVDFNGDGLVDIIIDPSAYFANYQKTGAPLQVCTQADGCYNSIYLFGQNTSLIGGGQGTTTKYNTRTIFSEQILAINVVSASDFEAWSAGKPYTLANTNPVLVVERNATNCYNDELTANNDLCIKYSQYVGDFNTGALQDLYNPGELSTSPQYDTRYIFSPANTNFEFQRDAAILARGQVLGSGFGQKLDPGSMLDAQFAADPTATVPFRSYHIEMLKSNKQSIFIPTNTDRELASFISAVQSGNVPGVCVETERLQFTPWVGDLKCPPVRPTDITVAAERFCQSATSDYRPCSDCMAAAKAGTLSNMPDDWQLCCHQNKDCPKNACLQENNGVWLTEQECETVITDYFAGKTPKLDPGVVGSWMYPFNNVSSGDPPPPSNNSGSIHNWCEYQFGYLCANGHICLAANSMIALPDGTTKRIDQIKVGETVLGFTSGKGKLKPFKVATVAVTPKQDLLKINGTLSVTPNHRVFVAGGNERQASQLKVGDILLAADRSQVVIKTIESLPAEDTVYNLVLDKPAIGFVADGIRVTDYDH